jgi:hypothetical protein
MKCAGEMCSGAIIYMPSSIKIFSDMEKFMEGEEGSDRQYCDLIRLLLFFQNK